jgi:restriction system protein
MADNRIGWAASYLTRVEALSRPARGRYQITDVGRRLLRDHPAGISEAELRAIAKPGDEWWITRTSTGSVTVEEVAPLSTELDPIEQVQQGVTRITDDVAAQLLSRILAQEPVFFEQAVLDLLMAMGYGGSDGSATRTQLSNDAGIDGVIDQDALGLSRIYVQAKRYSPEHPVDRPTIQAFVGALAGNQANQGVFITTSRFTPAAAAYAQQVPTRVVLIDGARLTRLMIHYGVGVQVRRTVQIVEIDEDFFE